MPPVLETVGSRHPLLGLSQLRQPLPGALFPLTRDLGLGWGQGAVSGPRWAAEHGKDPRRAALAGGRPSVWGAVPPARPAISRWSSHSQATAPGPPSGKSEYVPLGLHPVPRGGNWVHPKNNRTCKQLRHANVFLYPWAKLFKGTAVCFPGAGRSRGVVWALLGSPSSSNPS